MLGKMDQYGIIEHFKISIQFSQSLRLLHRRIQRDLEAGIPVWALKLGAQKSLLVQHILKEMCNLLKKWPLNLWWILNKTNMEVGNIIKAATFKSFLKTSY